MKRALCLLALLQAASPLACSDSSDPGGNAATGGGSNGSAGGSTNVIIGGVGSSGAASVGQGGTHSGPPGCTTNPDCASGICSNHDCTYCQGDIECGGGHACGTGVCAPQCTTDAACGAGLSCCAGHCIDSKRDVNHCGSCSAVCNANQICISTGCVAASISNVCGNPHTTLIKDGIVPDDAANATIQAALVKNCTTAPAASVLEKTIVGAVNPATGRPVAGGGDLLTVSGGAYVQKLVDYLDKTGVTPVYLNTTDQSWQYVMRVPGGGLLVAELLFTSFSVTHDILLIEMVRDPASGTPILIAFGQEAESTTAAAWYVANEMLPNRARYEKSWYVYEWTAASVAGGAATYTMRASGP